MRGIVSGDVLDITNVEGNPVGGICVTTNGVVTKEGRLIMGAGVAKAFRDKFTDLDLKLGELVSNHGNHVYCITDYDIPIFSFPTKDNWKDSSRISLIVRSARELTSIIKENGYTDPILLPKPGCGYGRLSWGSVFCAIDPILPDNIIFVSFQIGVYHD